MPPFAARRAFDVSRLLALFLACVVSASAFIPTPAPIFSLPLGDANSSTASLPVLTVPNGIVLMYAHVDPSSQWGLLNPTVAFVNPTTRAVMWEWALPAENGPWFDRSCDFIPSSDGAAVFVVSENGVWRISLANGNVAWSRTDVKVWAARTFPAFIQPSLLAGLVVTWATQNPSDDFSYHGQLSLLSEDTGAARYTRDLGIISGTFVDPTHKLILAFSYS